MKKILNIVHENLMNIINNYIANLGPVAQVVILFLICLFTLAFFFTIAGIISRNKQWFYKFAKTELLADLTAQSVSLSIKLISIIFVLYIIGAQSVVGFVIGTAGVLGLGISFAFKDIVENYIAGIILSIRQPFRKGDHISVDSLEGIVLRMTTRMTMIKSFEGNNISIPNATIFKSNIINYSVIPERRFEFQIGITPDADPNYAREVGITFLKNVEGVLADPAPFALIDSIGDSSIVISFYGWVDQDSNDFFQVRSSSIARVKEEIEKSGIEIPDPSYVIKLKNIDNETREDRPLSSPQSESTDVRHLMSPINKQKDIIEKQIERENSHSNLLNNESVE